MDLPGSTDLESTDTTQQTTFQDRLGTNYAPTTTEIAQIKALITSDQSSSDAIDNEISKLQQQISRLLDQQRPILQRINDHKALLHPVRRLPTEILQEIFMSSLPATPDGSMHPEDCPMVFISVCRTWREIALQTPSLWAAMYIPLPTFSKNAHQLSLARAAGVQQWLTRSGSIPLSLTIVQIPDTRHVEEQTALDHILPILLSHADRWANLHLAISWEAMSKFIDQSGTSRYPLLQGVTLRVTSPRWPPAGSTTEPESPAKLLSAPFFQSPVLTELILNGLPEEIHFTDMQVTWERLTSLSVDADVALISPTALFSILRTTQHLENLRLSISIKRGTYLPTNPDETSIITLPKLKHLSVLEYSPFPFFGKVVQCPALEYLEYYDAFPDWEAGPHNSQQLVSTTDQSALASFLSHSGPQLHTLMFDPAVYTTPFIIQFLHHCKDLQSLVFLRLSNRYTPRSSTWTTVNSAFLQAFVTPNQDSLIPDEPICPRLTNLAFDNAVGFSPDDLKAFVTAKQSGSLPGVEKLRKLVVSFSDAETPEGYSDALIPLFKEAGQVAIKLPSKPPPSTLRDGIWECAPFNMWHSFSFRKYFGGS